MTRGVLWDSSAILALLDADDADHARAVEIASQIAGDRRPSFITNYIEAKPTRSWFANSDARWRVSGC
jgi:hypothetical protein